MIGFWVTYAFYLQENGALYYGSGDSYWKVTFESLIETIFFKDIIINGLVLVAFIGMGFFWVYKLVREKTQFLTGNFSIAFCLLCSLIITFFLLKQIIGVNYPEDRTGLFFYVFYVVSFGFMINELNRKVQIAFMVIPMVYLSHFLLHTNFRIHPWRVYETMPPGFFTLLRSEQEKVPYRITIGGHRMREFFYAFMNYNSPLKLNHITSPEALQMNCDYALAYKQDKPWYDKYYEELAVDHDWDFRLLKRRIPLERQKLYSTTSIPEYVGNGEYYNAFEKLDTTFDSENPLLAEFEFTVEKAPEPFNAWLVLQIDSYEEESNIFLRVPLNLIRYDWNTTKNCTISLVSGTIPLKIKRIVCYLWNIDKKKINMKMNSFSLFRLNGDGVKELSKAEI